MKSRRIAIISFLLCACLIIGLGYAAISKELAVSGTIHGGARSDLQVWFVDAKVDNTVTNNKCLTATLSTANESLTVNMETDTLLNVGDKAVAVFTIQNKELVANATHARLYDPTLVINGSNSTFTNPRDYYDVKYEFVDATSLNTALNDGHTVDIADDALSVDDLPPQHSVYLVVTVTLTQSIIDQTVTHAANFTITYTAEATVHND